MVTSTFPSTPQIPSTAIDRFGLIMEGLCRGVAASHSRGVAGPLILLIWGRLRRMMARFAAAARTRAAGTPATGAPGTSTPATRAGVPRKPRPPPPSQGLPSQGLPRGFGWLLRLTPDTAVYASQLQALLADPEMAALVSAAPRIGRVLRPLCRMLALEPPRALLLPRRPARPRPAPISRATTARTAIARTAKARTAAPGRAAARGSPPALPPSRWRPERPDPWPDWERAAGLPAAGRPKPAQGR